MQKYIARIGHLNFSSAAELENFSKQYSQEAISLSREALELKLITTSDNSALLLGIYKNLEDAEIVLRRLKPWLAQFSEVYEQSFYLMGDLEFSYQKEEV